ncbi:unnamed protein product [Linum trigynum]|uniref:Uncharacterized protein n=1 Tax=Linum trigynum TaxID=586398 RepID=A0AAV2E8I8_9ROSI
MMVKLKNKQSEAKRMNGKDQPPSNLHGNSGMQNAGSRFTSLKVEDSSPMEEEEEEEIDGVHPHGTPLAPTSTPEQQSQPAHTMSACAPPGPSSGQAVVDRASSDIQPATRGTDAHQKQGVPLKDLVEVPVRQGVHVGSKGVEFEHTNSLTGKGPTKKGGNNKTPNHHKGATNERGIPSLQGRNSERKP